MAWISEGKPAVHKHRGRWVVREPGYDTVTGKVRPKQHGTFSPKRDALALARKAGEGRISTSDQTLEDFLYGVWIPSKESRVEQSTLNQYLWAVDGHMVPLLGAVKLKDMSPELIDGWIHDLSRAPAGGGKPRIGVTSTRLARKTLSMALQEAVQRASRVAPIIERSTLEPESDAGRWRGSRGPPTRPTTSGCSWSNGHPTTCMR